MLIKIVFTLILLVSLGLEPSAVRIPILNLLLAIGVCRLGNARFTLVNLIYLFGLFGVISGVISGIVYFLFGPKWAYYTFLLTQMFLLATQDDLRRRYGSQTETDSSPEEGTAK